jgi:hypothetical protein
MQIPHQIQILRSHVLRMAMVSHRAADCSIKALEFTATNRDKSLSSVHAEAPRYPVLISRRTRSRQRGGRAESEELDVRFDEGDAEALPYELASFDFVTSLFGAMFAPRPELVASELLRVPPGRDDAMGNWTKEGFIGQMFKAIARFIAPPGMSSPVPWGDENTVRERFGTGVSDLRLTRVIYRFDYPFSPADVVEFFRQNYGPTTRAFAALRAED